MVIRNCTLTNSATNQLCVQHLTIQSKCSVKQFLNGSFEMIDVISVDQDSMVDLSECNQLNSQLNSLKLSNVRLDLGLLQGIWSYVEIKNCSISGNFANKFQCADLVYHVTESEQRINKIMECRPKRLQLYYERNYSIQFQHLDNIKMCRVDITFKSCNIDFDQLKGTYNKLEFNDCQFTGCCSKTGLYCQNLVFQRSYPYQHNISNLKSQMCTIQRIRRYDIKIPSFPQSNYIKVENSCLILQKISNVQTLILKNVDIEHLTFSLFKNLSVLKCIGKKNQQIFNLERIIMKRVKFTAKKQTDEELLNKIDKDSNLKFKNIVKMEEDIEYLKYLLESVELAAE
ncbi:Hypothetical_protein [Hexamita inflata]|uniref:Hypothetical_protein n=1 Tax=Hexamita inflata TaxID=28002 RepID=A0AA86U1A1_9EUKA|nr:Hypothetical protein HINF_LOCUS24119 [Hexamita inflata]